MPRLAGNETSVSPAVSRGSSLRTSIPIHVIRQPGLSRGDRVAWDMDRAGGEWVAALRKAWAPADVLPAPSRHPKRSSVRRALNGGRPGSCGGEYISLCLAPYGEQTPCFAWALSPFLWMVGS